MGTVCGVPVKRPIGISAKNDIKAENLQNVVGNRNIVTQILPPNVPSPVRTFNRQDSALVVARASEFFKGRGKVMDDIDKILKKFQGKSVYTERILVVYGIPGIGKSELMRQFIQEYDDKYPNTAWINAESTETITEGFKHLAGVLQIDLGQSSCTLEVIATKVYKHIENVCEPNFSLIILDNVTDLVKIRSSLPVSQSISKPPLIVMTAIEPSKIYKNLQLEELRLKEAILVFQAFLGKELSEEKLPGIQKLLVELAELVGCHPLAIVISASYISGKKDSRYLEDELTQYIASVRELSAKFAKSTPEVEGATEYKNTIKALWETTIIKRIKENKDADAAFYLLRVLGYLDPENVEEEELQQLCSCNCPLVDKDDGMAGFFEKDGHRAVSEGISQLQRLSVLMPISKSDMNTNKVNNKSNRRYRMHRLLQRLAREEDVEQIGIRRAFYHCIDYTPPFIYPGCLEYLQTMVKKSIQLDEKLKQMCIAVAITAKDTFPDDTLARLINHFVSVGGNSGETEVLLSLAQLHNNLSANGSDDASSTVQTMCGVISLATNWIQSGYGSYLIQDCALKIIMNALYTSPESLDRACWPEDFSKNLKLWLQRLIKLHEEQTEEERKNFSKIMMDSCQLRMCRALTKGLEAVDGNIKSLEDSVNCLVRQTYDKCQGDENLEDGYWHVLVLCLRIKACHRFLQQNMEPIVKQAADTMAISSTKTSVIGDGLLECFLLVSLEPHYVSQICSDPYFLQEFSRQLKVRVKGVKGDFKFLKKDISWGIFLLVACIQEPDKMDQLFASWDPKEEFPRLQMFMMKLSKEAALFYRRWAANLDEILGGFAGGTRLLRVLQEVDARAPGDTLVRQLISAMVRTYLRPIEIGQQHPKSFRRKTRKGDWVLI